LDGLERCLDGAPTITGLTLGDAAPAERHRLSERLATVGTPPFAHDSTPARQPIGR
jgi:hypothetical protein